MASGIVKWFNTTRGYGFIQPETGGKDVFVHITAVEKAGMDGLPESAKVTYDIISDAARSRREICSSSDAYPGTEFDNDRPGSRQVRRPSHGRPRIIPNTPWRRNISRRLSPILVACNAIPTTSRLIERS
jgi:CspA family cold shock protein